MLRSILRRRSQHRNLKNKKRLIGTLGDKREEIEPRLPAWEIGCRLKINNNGAATISEYLDVLIFTVLLFQALNWVKIG
jgi:hypothetical protein